ncbi:hypothetical protein ACFQL4_14625 [Halosimplex aquaticum]
MRRTVLAFAVAASLVLAGCTTGQPSTESTVPSLTPSPAPSPSPQQSADSPTPTATKTPGSVPSTALPTQTQSAPTSEPTSVEYVVRAGDIPDEFASVEVTFRVVFVDKLRDLGPCYPDVFSGPYKPTLTPLPTPTGECHESQSVTVDVTEVSGERSLGNFSAPGSTSGHALIATEVEATHTNGTAVTTIYGTGGAELIRSDERPSGPYGVEIGFDPAPDGRDYDYWFLHEEYDISG